jgi:rhodanese-related sulfurtransferase
MTIRARWSDLSLNQRLALGALALGAVALFAQPSRGSVVTLDVKELATIVEREDDHVTAGELAGWIVEGHSDYRLVDLRGAKQYMEYHVPTAENMTLAALPDAPLAHNEKIVLYSEGGIHASQAWMLMRALGFKSVYTLKGGLEQWKDDVLFPTLADNATSQERTRFERSTALARFFGGAPRTGGSAALAPPMPSIPKVEPTVAPPGPGSAPPKKKKEGC